MRRILLCLLALLPLSALAEPRTLLNASYDPTREFYEDYNALFTAHWKSKTGEKVIIRQSHGASGRQARAVMDGLAADVVTLALAADIDAIARTTPLIPADWQTRLPHNSAPYTSAIVFLVRKGNPKHIQDWPDLVRDGVQVITPSPKTSGGARWNYLAAWAYATGAFGGDDAKTKDYMKKLYANVPVLDTGARGSTTTFVRRSIGDVLIAWENEAHLVMDKLGAGEFEIVYPSVTIRAEPSVAVVEGVARAHKTEDVAWEYLAYLYSPEAQTLAAKHYYRPTDPKIAEQFKDRFPEIPMKTIADLGGWSAVTTKHFAEGGLFDQLYINN